MIGKSGRANFQSLELLSRTLRRRAGVREARRAGKQIARANGLGGLKTTPEASVFQEAAFGCAEADAGSAQTASRSMPEASVFQKAAFVSMEADALCA